MALEALTDAQISEALNMLDGWERKGDALARTFSFDTYVAGLGFATAVGMICEAQNHHPELLQIGYKKVMLEFLTHDAGNAITQNDVDVAKAINQLLKP